MRRTRRLLGAAATSFVYHPAYEYVMPGVPFDPLRGQRVLAFLYDEGLISTSDLTRPVQASFEQISRTHTSEYLEGLDQPETQETVLGFRTDEDRWQEFVDAQRIAAGGTVEATRLALRSGGVAVNLCGGFHHAHPDKGAGFCILNDIAVAIEWARAEGFDESILVVDLDVHDGNGTRAAFAGDASVYTFSIHNETWGTQPALADTQVALGPDVTDGSYLATLERELFPVLDNHRPGLVFYVAGADVAAEDRLGNWLISAAGLLRRDRFVITALRESRPPTPVVILPGGGYGDKAWRHLARSLAWLLSGEELDPTEDVDAIVRRFRRLESDATTNPQADPDSTGIADWTLSEEDLQLIVPPESRDTKVLGEYSRNGMELTLERLGILNQVRARGFVHPVVTVHTASAVGHTIRIYGDAEYRELLMELRIRRDRTTISGMDLLYAEWLLLQNPRKQFTHDRRRLPGQQHPGLGLLAEIVALMVVLCERAGLDGIIFVPAHYYMAALGRRHLVFVHPNDAVVFEAMRHVLSGLPLADATRAVEEGRVIDATTRTPVEWHTPLMVLPVSEESRERLGVSGGTESAVPRYELSDV
jgi:acetoin utilization deacetylase AcuC-like enzyme